MLAELTDSQNSTQAFADMDIWSAAGEIDRLEAFGHALVQLPDPPERWPFSTALLGVLAHLALTESASRAAAAVRIGTSGLPVERVRMLAGQLAQGQRAHVLRALLADLPPGEDATELGACLLHEMIIRGKPVTKVADIWTRRLAGHPLAGLHLDALPGEAWLPITHFGFSSWSQESPLGLPLEEPLSLTGTVPEVTREDGPADLTAAIETWPSMTNGKAEAAVFRLTAPLDAGDVGNRTIEALGLACLAGGGLRLWSIKLDDVMGRLFAAGAQGGAYGPESGGAYGRLAAWRSVTALAGGSHEGCAWWAFNAANDWFYDRAWDLGVICLRPGGRVLAVLAATDSD